MVPYGACALSQKLIVNQIRITILYWPFFSIGMNEWMKFESISYCQNGFVMQSGFSSFIVAYNKSSSYNFWFASFDMIF